MLLSTSQQDAPWRNSWLWLWLLIPELCPETAHRHYGHPSNVRSKYPMKETWGSLSTTVRVFVAQDYKLTCKT